MRTRTAFDDLIEFARLEVTSGDLEPWAAIIRELRDTMTLSDEEALWLAALYNTYDSLGSAWQAFRWWPTINDWDADPDRVRARYLPIMQERRNLHGGRVCRRLASHYDHVINYGTQRAWLESALRGDPERDFQAVMALTRQVWGVGRQAAFEWAEFAAKVGGLPISAPTAELWESSGPRRSLERLYGGTGDEAWLNSRAADARDMLRNNGIDLPWEDFETVICDFHVMRGGHYYPGRHLAALREEIDSVPQEDRQVLLDAWRKIIPAPWAAIQPGIDKAKMGTYAATGIIHDGP